MAGEYNEQNIGFRQGVQYVMERLDGSAKNQDLTTLIKATAPGDMKGGTPSRTHINRSMITTDELKVVSAYDDNALIKKYMRAPNSANFDAMTADRHYAEAHYSSTVATPKVFKDRAVFNNWDEMRNGFNIHNDKLVAVVNNIRVARNKAMIEAIKAKKVKRTTRDDDAEPDYADVTLPDSQYFDVPAGQKTLKYKDLLTIRARCQRMSGFGTYMLMSWAQQAEFKGDEDNVKFLQNKDFVASSDLRMLDQSIAFQGITPVIVEDEFNIDDNKVFGLDESEILIFNPTAVTKVKWTDESLYGVDSQADMQAHFLRKIREDFVRTSDKGVVIVRIPALAPKLEVGSTTVSLSTGGETKTMTVSVNDSRVMAQTWTATTDAAWLTLKSASGTNSGDFGIEASANGTGSSRSAVVKVVSGDLVENITVTQA